MPYYRRNLPHWQPQQAEYFATFRLTGSIPSEAIEQLNLEKENLNNSDLEPTLKQRRIFAKYEKILDGSTKGPTWLKHQPIAKIVCDAIHYRDQTEYNLYAYCVMPNHVHLVFKLFDQNKTETQGEFPVTKMLQGLKRYTAVESNKILNRKGQFWQHESFDRVIRDADELQNTIIYVLKNPVKAGLIDHWENWPYNYCKPEFAESFK